MSRKKEKPVIYGIPMGRICEQMGIGAGALVEVFHTVADKHIPFQADMFLEDTEDGSWR